MDDAYCIEIFIFISQQKFFRFALSSHTINTYLFVLYTALNGDLESIYHAVAVLEALKCGEKVSDDVTKKISAGLSGDNVVDFYRAVATWEALQANVSIAFAACLMNFLKSATRSQVRFYKSYPQYFICLQ